jgi:ABC-2 type transport system ATP-binding protein
MTSSKAAIEIDHLSCSFRRNEALHDVCLRIPVGSVFGLVGLNGAGKTTLIRHVIGALRPQSGTVRVLGEDPARVPESVLGRMGYVSEEDSLPRWMTVGQLIDFSRALYRDWDDATCEGLLEQFSLDRRKKLSDLSKGGRARAGLLVAMAHRPELLILDEPSYGLDPIARQDILEAVVRTAGDEGRTVLFSSHLLDEVSRVCDVVGVMNEGRLIEVIAMQDLAERYTEVVCETKTNEAWVPHRTGTFGSQRKGQEWSVVIDRSLFPTDAMIDEAFPEAQIIDARPASLDRWFAARVNAGVR